MSILFIVHKTLIFFCFSRDFVIIKKNRIKEAREAPPFKCAARRQPLSMKTGARLPE